MPLCGIICYNYTGMDTPENKSRLPEKNPDTDGLIIEPLRTYEQDVRNVVASQNISVVKMALAQGRRQEAEEKIEEAASPRSKRNILISSISLILILGSIAAIGGTYYFLSVAKQSLLSNGQAATPTFISTESAHTIVLNDDTKQELAQKIAAEGDSLPNGLIERVFFQDSAAPATSTFSTNDFLNILQTQAPAPLVRSLYPEFAFGFYGKDRVPFVIFETSSYDEAYAGMLNWEPYMRDEFSTILFSTDFENDLPISTSTPSIATGTTSPIVVTQPSTQAKNAVAFPTAFKDLVVDNKDTRALYNRAGELLVLYGFVDKKYIVITRDPDALNEIYNRLRESELSR